MMWGPPRPPGTPVRPRWVAERCCPDPTCPGSWWVRNAMSYHLADDDSERQGVFPTEREAQGFADTLNENGTGAMQV